MTIEEFIEARIAEDEDNAACDGVESDGHGMCYYWSERRARDVAAYREIADLHGMVEYRRSGDEKPVRSRCAADGQRGPCDTLRALASVWRDHEDYDKEWAP